MCNLDKYDFEYFTLEKYECILNLALQNGFEFILHKDEFIKERKDIIWRHDVEFSPDIALKMANIEHNLGVKATYFFQLHSDYYNSLSNYFTKIVHRIKELGHHIGLHFDAHYFNVKNKRDLDQYITLDKNYFESIFNIKIDTFSFHNTNSFILSCEDYQYGGLINVYSHEFKSKYNYCADSTGYWRYEVLHEVINNPSVRHLQVLTHDAMWSEEVLPPRRRVMKSIYDNAERIIDSYDRNLPLTGAKNIDWEGEYDAKN